MNREPRWVVLIPALVALILIPLSIRAEEPNAAKFALIRQAMQKYVDDKVVAGVVTVVGNSKGIINHEAVGSLTLDPKVEMPKDALFRIASMTKPITALGIMILSDEGKLSVDDPVEKHLPEFRGQMLVSAKNTDAVTLKKPPRPITLRDLLTHTSGLPNFPPGLADIYSKRDRTLAEMTLAISQRPLDFEPGSKWSYCNSGIDTLGRIIEVVSGQPYEVFLAKRIFQPLGMKNTTFVPTKDQVERLAGLYEIKDGKLSSVVRPLIGLPSEIKHPIPAGGLISNGEDLAKLYQMMLNKGTFGMTRLVSEKAVAEMTKTQTGDLKTGFVDGMSFGYGWAVVKEPKGVTEMLSPGTFGHGGAFGTQGWIDPKQDLFMILLFQRSGMPNGDASDLRRDLQTLAVQALK